MSRSSRNTLRVRLYQKEGFGHPKIGILPLSQYSASTIISKEPVKGVHIKPRWQSQYSASTIISKGASTQWSDSFLCSVSRNTLRVRLYQKQQRNNCHVREPNCYCRNTLRVRLYQKTFTIKRQSRYTFFKSQYSASTIISKACGRDGAVQYSTESCRNTLRVRLYQKSGRGRSDFLGISASRNTLRVRLYQKLWIRRFR